jgi:nitroreductase
MQHQVTSGTAEVADMFAALVRTRRSTRAFLPQPVPEETIVSVLEDAQQTPSNCNTQPWDVHLVSGETLERLSAAMQEANAAGERTLDFTFDASVFPGRYGERSRAQGSGYYQALGVAREDRLTRQQLSNRNLSFFGAPHAAMLFMPAVGDSVRVASDIGMYAQSFLLSLAARGLSGVPQTMLGYFAEPARRLLDVDEDHKLLFGISFGYPDTYDPAAQYVIGRDHPLDSNVTFHH